MKMSDYRIFTINDKLLQINQDGSTNEPDFANQDYYKGNMDMMCNQEIDFDDTKDSNVEIKSQCFEEKLFVENVENIDNSDINVKEKVHESDIVSTDSEEETEINNIQVRDINYWQNGILVTVDETKQLEITVSKYIYAMSGKIDPAYENWTSIDEFEHFSWYEIHEVNSKNWWCTKCHMKYEQRHNSECRIETIMCCAQKVIICAENVPTRCILMQKQRQQKG